MEISISTPKRTNSDMTKRFLELPSVRRKIDSYLLVHGFQPSKDVIEDCKKCNQIRRSVQQRFIQEQRKRFLNERAFSGMMDEIAFDADAFDEAFAVNNGFMGFDGEVDEEERFFLRKVGQGIRNVAQKAAPLIRNIAATAAQGIPGVGGIVSNLIANAGQAAPQAAPQAPLSPVETQALSMAQLAPAAPSAPVSVRSAVMNAGASAEAMDLRAELIRSKNQTSENITKIANLQARALEAAKGDINAEIVKMANSLSIKALSTSLKMNSTE